jgi:hypothetical protein
MKLNKQKVLVAGGKKYVAGVDYTTEQVPANLRKYFGADYSSVEPEVIYKEVEVAVPAFGVMTDKQLESLSNDQLYILAVQYECENVNKRSSKPELVEAVLEAQNKSAKEAADEGGDE